MATFVKLAGFVEHLAEKEHNLGSDQLVVALTNTAPGSESTPPTGATGTNVLANLTQVAYTFCSSRNITTSASAQSSGTYKLTLTDLVLTASGGAIGPFQYIYIYNDTSTSDKIINYYDYGSSITVNDTETFTIDFDGTNGHSQLA
jgi:hypothetical protein